MPEPVDARIQADKSSGGLDVGMATDVGRVRELNEDAVLVVRPEGARQGHVLVAVADGMGGHKAGEVASALAVESLRQALDLAEAEATPETLLARGVTLGNRTIWDAAARDVDHEGMGTTLVAALLSPGGGVAIANVGDSRAYVVSGGNAALVTSDHSWVNQQVLSGAMTELEARRSPFRNVITRSLGTMPEVEADLFLHQLAVGDALVLVSDGVTTYLDETDISVVVRATRDAQAAAERLVAEAVARGGADNATAVVVRRALA